MKPLRNLLVTACVIAAIVAVGVIINKAMDNNKYGVDVSLYFFNDKKTSIVEEVHEINYNTNSDLPDKVLEELIKGPVNKKCVSPINKNVKILHIKSYEEKLNVDFSREFLSGDSSQDILATYAVVKSLCSLRNVKSVKVTVENKDIVAPDGSVIDYLSSSDINISSEDNSSGVVVLYFPSKTTQKLVTEVRNISSENKKTKEQYIVNEIIKGPQNKELQSVLASDTTLISAETKDGVCYLNFKSNFIDKNSGSKEKLAVYAIVNSLTELENVAQVQFLIDGKKVDTFGQTYIGDIFYRNESLIEGKQTHPSEENIYNAKGE